MIADLRVKPKNIVFLCVFLFLLSQVYGGATSAFESVAIDPGHGGEDWGCTGVHGSMEKTINLQVAQRLAQIIQDRLGLKAFLTRDADHYVELVERTGIANHNKADLFISLHTNCTFSPGQTGQIMVFLSPVPTLYNKDNEDVKDKKDRRNLAADEDAQEAEAILWDMVNTGFHNESFLLARIIAQEARKSGLWRQSLLKEAPVAVLTGANMPAVEVEMDFLTASSQAQERLMDPWYQEKICEVLYRAIIRFRYTIEEDPNAAAW